MRYIKAIFLCVVFLVCLGLAVGVVVARENGHGWGHGWSRDSEHDDGERRGHGGGKNRKRHHGGETEEDSVPPVDHAAYKENCGGCHFAYQPALLPSGSWGRILESRGDHFGEAIELSPSQAEEIAAYLKANAADRSDCETAREIMESLGSGTPLRVTEVPKIRQEHRKISADVFARPSIGTPSNCPACHAGAERGSYNDDSVRIPSK